MIDAALLCSVASQLMTQPEVNIQGRKLRVSHTSLHHFRTIDTQGRERNHRKPGAFCNIKESDRESPKGNTLLQLFQAGVRAETPGDIFFIRTPDSQQQLSTFQDSLPAEEHFQFCFRQREGQKP